MSAVPLRSETVYRSYYGKPILKSPVWEPYIPGYFFLGGAGGAAAGLKLAARLSGNDQLARAASYVEVTTVGLSPVLLIADLGRPERFLNMLRVFKVTSPMSVGTWILAASGLTGGGGAILEATKRLPRWRLAAEVAGAGFGPFLATYTAALLADTAIPVWSEARWQLPFVFAGDSATSAGALCAMVTAPSSAAPARRLAVLGAALELASVSAMEKHLGALGAPYRAGALGIVTKASKGLTVGGLVAMALGGRRRSGAIGAGLLLLAGTVCRRMAVFRAGFASANDPAFTIGAQRTSVHESKLPPLPVEESSMATQEISSGNGSRSRAERRR